MKAILQFSLPDDKGDFKQAIHGMDWALMVWELDQYLRGIDKYQNGSVTAESVREKIRELMADDGLEFPQ